MTLWPRRQEQSGRAVTAKIHHLTANAATISSKALPGYAFRLSFAQRGITARRQQKKPWQPGRDPRSRPLVSLNPSAVGRD
ncbi:hypothetical protein Cob_v004348 [Colletotrichum orbiculare MAFF 240422]|uniref:Uncharacterized protein n=1 Tax=Colletotrichum orbiculare (strain 104-T / ATCC 96160 / CBS 514.97 / LARS 414 / MAFF 240422) TaxID=1213857 RepID=A0A484FYD0_COLOR|nr:hypothetical protein Cob_v004348 [Colletotrichum orbiculare MAFF 240422]